MAESLLLFGYGSLVNRASAEETLGRALAPPLAATLRGWRRRWSLLRDNAYCEKTFALEDGTVPDWLLTLNVEPTGDHRDRVNGVVFEIDAGELPSLDLREARYRRVDVSSELERPAVAGRVITYTATPRHTAATTPEGALILDTYLDAVERGFRALGERELDEFRATTGEPPAPIASCRLLRHSLPGLTPVRW